MSHQQQHQHCFTSLFRFADRRLPLQLTSSRSHLGCLCASAFHWCLRQTLSVSAFTSLVVRRTAQLTLSVVLSLSLVRLCPSSLWCHQIGHLSFSLLSLFGLFCAQFELHFLVLAVRFLPDKHTNSKLLSQPASRKATGSAKPN